MGNRMGLAAILSMLGGLLPDKFRPRAAKVDPWKRHSKGRSGDHRPRVPGRYGNGGYVRKSGRSS